MPTKLQTNYRFAYLGSNNIIRTLVIFLCTHLVTIPLQAKPSLTIVATTSMIGDVLSNIVKDSAHIITLMGPGVDPHAYKATRKDIEHLSKANIIYYNGLHLEGKMADMLANLGKKKPVYAASDGIGTSQYIGDPRFNDGVDPHIWFDIPIWKEAIAYMSKKLQAIDTASADYYANNTADYLKKLDDLHETVTRVIQQIPKKQRVLITAHDAFSYFGRRYEIQVRPLQGISSVEEVGLKDIWDLVNFIVSNKIKAIFPESSIPPKPLQAVVEGCKAKGHDVILGEELYSDALGSLNTPEGTYVGMVLKNVQIITESLK